MVSCFLHNFPNFSLQQLLQRDNKQNAHALMMIVFPILTKVPVIQKLLIMRSMIYFKKFSFLNSQGMSAEKAGATSHQY